MPARFLAITDLPREDTAGSAGRLMASLEQLAQQARGRGVRAIETLYSLDRGRAYTLFDAADEASVRDLCQAAGMAVVDVAPGERIYTSLLGEPNRARGNE